jgi:hypothetical protein
MLRGLMLGKRKDTEKETSDRFQYSHNSGGQTTLSVKRIGHREAAESSNIEGNITERVLFLYGGTFSLQYRGNFSDELTAKELRPDERYLIELRLD